MATASANNCQRVAVCGLAQTLFPAALGGARPASPHTNSITWEDCNHAQTRS
jgi:hypothetical protein